MKNKSGYPSVIPYLIVKNAQRFIDFTEMVFGSELQRKEMRDEKCIKHAEVKIDDSIIMFADSTDQYLPQPGSLFIYVDNADEIFQKALDHGGTIVMDLSNQDYGRTGGIKDPIGNTWWITSETH
ncbi:VOC family protein [Arachidicoccus sp.]|jgi:PhnB protein|uniref:VOC family protein n=1 Tax=Arachidicoccus sp. TaxID=1872624 RepID=UPI003D24E2C0